MDKLLIGDAAAAGGFHGTTRYRAGYHCAIRLAARSSREIRFAHNTAAFNGKKGTAPLSQR